MTSFLTLALLLQFAASGSGRAADVDAGKADFKKCALCHTTEAGKNKVGPSLFGVVGRKAASLEGYNYSEANKNSGIVWSKETFLDYIKDCLLYTSDAADE